MKNIKSIGLSLLLLPLFSFIRPVMAQIKQTQKPPALEEAEELRFTPHITAEAYTRKKGKFAFQRSVGANLKTNLLLTSTTYAITNRMEIGTTLMYYLIDTHRWNATFKYNFWRTKQYLWSFGFSFFESNLETTDMDPSLQNLDLKVSVSSFQILFNYLPIGSKFKYGVNYNTIVTSLYGLSEDEDNDLLLGSASEFGVDISYNFKQAYDITIGLGWLREQGVTALEEVEFGFGPSVRWYRPEKFLSSPTAGVHFTPKTSAVEFLLSSSFY